MSKNELSELSLIRGGCKEPTPLGFGLECVEPGCESKGGIEPLPGRLLTPERGRHIATLNGWQHIGPYLWRCPFHELGVEDANA